MCGIIGCFSDLKSDKSWLEDASFTIKHRGPDDSGEWWSEDGNVGFAQRRLAILDLSNLGRQPMYSKKYNLCIIFNGEIYNFRELRSELKLLGHSFISNSDTEVLLAAYAEWGKNCISKIEGMFVFAVYDINKKIIFIARDRSGEKPIFYYEKNNCLYFASELKALLKNLNLPRYLNYEALKFYLGQGFVHGDKCILQNYKKLPAAHTLTYSLISKKIEIQRYWQLPDTKILNSTTLNENSLLNELESILSRSISKQLIADVPVGILLSGGIDSSLIATLASRQKKISTFTAIFPGYKKYDESYYANIVAKHLNTNHKELVVDKEDLGSLIENLFKQFDEPMADSSMIPFALLSEMISKNCKVALGGDGGDELFGGYSYYKRMLWLAKYTKFMPRWLKNKFKKIEKFLPPGFYAKNFLSQVSLDFSNELPETNIFFNNCDQKKLINHIDDENFISNKIFSFEDDLLQNLTRRDFYNYLCDDILVKVDRASMMHSLEIRSPFLDHNVIEFAFSKVPSSLKANSKQTKILLKKLAKKILPNQLNLSRKQGFSIPLKQWLKSGSVRDLFWDTLNDKNCFFNKKFVKKLLNNQDKNFNNQQRLFALVQFELWRKYYKIEY